MSLVKISGNASGTGTLTVAAPNTNLDYTLTLPTATGTLLSSASTSNFPAGSVRQVVNATSSAVISSTSGVTWTDVLSASITPTSSSSKILILCSVNGCYKTANNTALGLQIIRGTSTLVTKIDGLIPFNNANSIASADTSTSYLDSPATTSSTTYKLQLLNISAVGTVYVNNYAGSAGDSVSTITLMEIAA